MLPPGLRSPREEEERGAFLESEQASVPCFSVMAFPELAKRGCFEDIFTGRLTGRKIAEYHELFYKKIFQTWKILFL